jgi:fatty-acyl-CoA synthase
MRVAGFADIGQMIAATALCKADAVALDDGTRTLTYAAFEARANRAARALLAQGVQPGDRIAVLAENRLEYLELAVAAARTGAILCALNWRFSLADLAHCVSLTRPMLLFVSDRHAPALADLDLDGIATIRFGDAYEALLAAAAAEAPTPIAEPEDGFIILFTTARRSRG